MRYFADMDDSDYNALRSEFPVCRRGTCPECGQMAGGHFNGCPEAPETDEDEDLAGDNLQQNDNNND